MTTHHKCKSDSCSASVRGSYDYCPKCVDVLEARMKLLEETLLLVEKLFCCCDLRNHFICGIHSHVHQVIR